jgi:hypothetical protein
VLFWRYKADSVGLDDPQKYFILLHAALISIRDQLSTIRIKVVNKVKGHYQVANKPDTYDDDE